MFLIFHEKFTSESTALGGFGKFFGFEMFQFFLKCCFEVGNLSNTQN